MIKEYKALYVTETPGGFIREVTTLNTNLLPANEVLIEVYYSALNYKDALSATGNKGVTKKYPFTPGIDAAGVVAQSSSPAFKEGDKVLVTGYDLGMNTPGGFGQYISVPAGWVVPLPSGLSLRESMILGTAGFTAGLALHRLETNGLDPAKGKVLVTGATGGVGSLSLMILKKAGYTTVAVTRKKEKEEYLLSIGADEAVLSSDYTDESAKPMIKGEWAGVIDTVGGKILETSLKSLSMWGSVAACGLTQSSGFSSTVFPFIIRGNNLLGVNSAETPMNLRREIWDRLSGDLKPDKLESIETVCSLEQLSGFIDQILKGEITGRVIPDLKAE
ncbi:MAG: YhdH/YhfP family quinone oxidoreductase [Ignavibacteriaceae bacterium]|nr:YhdH/YhfP family quinone oxidoreductase [Ignavibacteriaceae bacterium]